MRPMTTGEYCRVRERYFIMDVENTKGGQTDIHIHYVLVSIVVHLP
jgi:hypothetical protein